MTSLFAFTLILGGGLLLLGLFGDLFGGGDADGLDALDADIGLEGDALDAGDAAVAGDLDHAGLTDAVELFTIRNLTYFLFGFGGVGILLGWLQPELATPWLVLFALAGGLVSGLSAGVIFGWVKATDTGPRGSDDGFVGCRGRVTLPVRSERPGMVVVLRGHREHELRARPFDTDASAPESWKQVVVVEMDGGTALVSPLEELAPAEGAGRLSP